VLEGVSSYWFPVLKNRKSATISAAGMSGPGGSEQVRPIQRMEQEQLQIIAGSLLLDFWHLASAKHRILAP
jgi:hypothetical protein